MRRRYQRFLYLCLVIGVLVGVGSSGVLRQAPYYEPVPRLTGTVEGNGQVVEKLPVPERKFFLFLPVPWFAETELEPLEGKALTAEEEDDLDKLLRSVAAKKLTFGEQLQVLKIAFTRLSREERGHLVRLLDGGFTMDEAFAAYSLLRERLTDDEMVLTMGLVRKYQADVLKLLEN